VNTARAVPMTNETTPPPGMTLRMLTRDDPYVMTEVALVEKSAPTDWGKVEAYTQDSFAIGTTIKADPGLHFDQCIVTHLDTDHIRSALWKSANMHRHFVEWMRVRDASIHAHTCKNLVLLLKESHKTTDAGLLSIVYNAALTDLKPTNLIHWYGHGFPEKVADPLDGYEEYQAANWDSYGAEPITAETLAYARKLMKMMPTSLGAPDAAPAGDGSIALEWVPEDTTHKLDRLFLDIGPGEVWRAYWTLRNGEFYRVTHQGFSDETKSVLKDIFQRLTA
jgi:hypothetical protein